jgi:hypothetical protein
VYIALGPVSSLHFLQQFGGLGKVGLELERLG